MNLTNWWEMLTALQKVFWGFAVPFSLFFMLQTILTFMGADAGGELDTDVDSQIEGDHGIQFQFISLKNFVAFFTMFGWSGLACLEMGLGNGASVVIAIISGLAIMLIMASIYYYMSKLTDSGTLNMQNAIGKTGSVYLTIPAAKGGYGKVQIQIQGALRELSALTNDQENIPTDSIVKVEEVLNGEILIVTKQ